MAMTAADILDALIEARRFVKVATEAFERIEKDGPTVAICGTMETAAARRSSMDLTRALARFRAVK